MKPHRAVRIIRTYGQTPLLHVAGPGVPDMQPQRGSQPEGGITQKTPALEHEHIQQTIVGHRPGGDSESTSIISTVPRQNQVCLMPLFPYLHLQERGRISQEGLDSRPHECRAAEPILQTDIQLLYGKRIYPHSRHEDKVPGISRLRLPRETQIQGARNPPRHNLRSPNGASRLFTVALYLRSRAAAPAGGRGDAIQLTQELADRVDVMVAAGGDGTVNEVINGLVGSDVPLGLVPTGTVNVLALELGIPLDPVGAAEVVARGITRTLDLGLARQPETGDSRYFVLMAGVGIDALTIKELDVGLKNRFRRAAFVWTGVKAFLRNPSPLLQVEIGEKRHEANLVLAGNCRYYGGRFGITTRAVPNDGLLDVLMFEGRGFLRNAAFWLGTPLGLHVRHPGTSYVQERSLSIRADDANGPVWFHTDGELAGRLPVEIEIKENALRVLVLE